MKILVFNCGSSSLNFKVFSVEDNRELVVTDYGKAHRVGVTGSQPSYIEFVLYGKSTLVEILLPDHRAAALLILDHLTRIGKKFDVIGHRFVHGGSLFKKSTWFTSEIEPDLDSVLPLASIHNPNSMSVIEVCSQTCPGLPQFLTFDTAFHSALPEEAYRYLLPTSVIDELGFRKYGFHGLSYQYVCQEAADHLNRPLTSLRIIACHLGTGGSSVVAVLNGKSIETSMGFTPLAGLMMSTRTGDLDPMLVLQLIEDNYLTPWELDAILNKKSGLLGVSGFSSDIRDILEKMKSTGEPSAVKAFQMYVTRLRKVIGGYAALLGGVDVLIFTDDIGVLNADVRAEACQGLEWAGIALDGTLNDSVDPKIINQIQSTDARCVVLAMPTDEELVIAREGVRLVKECEK